MKNLMVYITAVKNKGAYASKGGKSLLPIETKFATTAAVSVSFHRPITNDNLPGNRRLTDGNTNTGIGISAL